jgi:hypothetical protein
MFATGYANESRQQPQQHTSGSLSAPIEYPNGQGMPPPATPRTTEQPHHASNPMTTRSQPPAQPQRQAPASQGDELDIPPFLYPKFKNR